MRIIPSNRDAIIASALRAKGGAEKLGDTVELAQNTAARIANDLHNLVGEPGSLTDVGKQGIYNQKSAQLTAARAARLVAIEAGRKLCASTVDLLKSRFGRTWNPAWAAAGFSRHSISVSTARVAPLIIELRNYFRDNPAHEVAIIGITAAALDEALAMVKASEHARDAALREFRDARDARDAATAKLKSRLSGLREELNRLIAADDNRWAEFGFSRPIDGQLPDRVQEVTVTPGLPGQVLVHWKPSPRAVNYRVRWKPESPDAEFIDAGLYADRAAQLTALPKGLPITVQVTARNRAGETLPTIVHIGVP